MGTVWLLKKNSNGKASPYDTNPLGGNALMCTPTQMNVELARFLIQQGADAGIADTFGRKPIDSFLDRSLAGEFNSEDDHIVRCTVEGTNYMERRCFSLLHKMILGLTERNLEFELCSSTASINSADAIGRSPVC